MRYATAMTYCRQLLLPPYRSLNAASLLHSTSSQSSPDHPQYAT
ncbi:hypothetical protein RCH10_003721 [Variovorax sp. GrIS 2.14]